MKVIRFRDRVAIPKKFKAGVELDNIAEQIKFELPQFADGQHENFIWENDDYSNIEELDDGVLTVTNAMSQYPGLATCYITINVGETLMWHSESFSMDIISLPDTEERIVQEFPGALMTAVLRAEDAQDAAEDAQEAAEDAQAAAETAQAAAETAQDAAEASVTAAAGQATAAAASATAAAGSATAAAGSATDAATSATAAAGSATNAAASATAAAGSATDAAASATTAAGKASDAATSATAAATTAAQIETEEAARQAAEAIRVTNEGSRQAAEEDREDAEDARETAETTRTNAESARMMAEAGRASAEGTRSATETARQAAETLRINAETARETAEDARESASAAAVEAAEDAADAANAAAEAVSGEVDELRSATQDITGNTIYPFTDGVWYNTYSTVDINAPESTTAARSSCVVPCAYGDQFTLTGSGFTSTHMLWCFVDDSGEILSPHAGSNETAEEKIITAPYNATHLVVNAKTSEPRSLYGGVIVNLKLDILNDVDDVSIHSVDGAISEATKTNTFTPDQFGHYYTSDGDGTYTSVYDRLTYDALFCCKLIQCLAGEIYHVHTYGHIGEKRGWIIFDTNGGRLKYCSTTGQVVDEYVKIPQNGAFLAINNKMDANNECWVVKRQDGEYFDFRGKNVAIIGDSISTNGDWSTDNPLGNVPEIIIQDADVGIELSAYITWWDVYTNAAGTSATNKSVGGHVFTADEIGTEVTFTPIADDIGKIVGKSKNNNAASQYVWWEIAADKLGFNPIPVCWSGSSITSHDTDILDDGGYIYKCSHAWHPSQIRKCGVRIPGGMTRTPPDVVIIYRGTNDFSKSPYTRLSDYLGQYPFSIPETDEYDDNGTTRCDYQKGLAITIDKLRAAYPEAQIVLCTFNYFHRISSSLPGFPSRNGTNTIYQYNNAIRAVADYFGCHVIEFDKDGITYGNATNGYYNESGTSPTSNLTHPNDRGQKIMGNRALIDLKKINALV